MIVQSVGRDLALHEWRLAGGEIIPIPRGHASRGPVVRVWCVSLNLLIDGEVKAGLGAHRGRKIRSSGLGVGQTGLHEVVFPVGAPGVGLSRYGPMDLRLRLRVHIEVFVADGALG